MAKIRPKVRSKKTIPYNFSEKHKEYIRRCRECMINVAEGAVRAGKTVDNILAFCEELKRTPDMLHLATASTAATAKTVIGDCNGFGVEHFFRGQCRWGKYKGNEALIICGKSTGYRKRIILFMGGAKADSYKKFRGMSFGMWIGTEINLHHDNTIKEAVNRQLAAKHRKIFWDLNPDNPRAKIYTDYIDKYAEQNKKGELLGGYNYEHFTIFDNINISESSKRIFISQYDAQTIWYKRDILGMRCIAEGLIFRKFADTPEQFITDEKAKNIRFISIGIDFGGNGSKTTFVATAMIGKFESVQVIADYKLSGGKGTIDPDKINRELLTFYQYVKQEYPSAEIPYIFPDCAEQTLITGIRLFMMKNRIRIAVTDSYKGRINDRIYALNGLMTQGRFKVHSSCKNVIDSLSSQCWDPKKLTEDVRLDDGTFDIDTADALEYSFSSFIKQMNISGGGKA